MEYRSGIPQYRLETDMEYRFQIKATPLDFFLMSMKKTYRSPLGVCNIIFFAAAVLLTLKFYKTASPLVQAGLMLMCLIIPVFQPLGVFFRAREYAFAIPQGLTLAAGNDGILVEAGGQSERIGWNKVSRVIDTGDCVVLKLAGGSGYFLFNRILGDQRRSFIDYANRQIG